MACTPLQPVFAPAAIVMLELVLNEAAVSEVR
jgi:hypothetical protein